MRVKKICIIYTGGTIGMMHSPDGYVPNPESFRSNLESIRDLNHPDAPIWAAGWSGTEWSIPGIVPATGHGLMSRENFSTILQPMIKTKSSY